MNLWYSKQQLHRLIAYKDLTNIAAYVQEEEKATIVFHARQLKACTFTFHKTWDMERCMIPYTIQPLDFRAQRNDDEEWCFMLNRMDYLSDLMLAGMLTLDHSFALCGKTMILTWIHQHPYLQQEASTRTLDTGIRIMNIMEALIYLLYMKCISDAELELILHSLYEQIQYLKQEYLPKYRLSNWGSIQTCAILSVLPFLQENYTRDELFRWASKEIETQLAIQVNDDGMHWEQSTMYHVEVLNYAMKLLYYQRFYGFSLDDIIERSTYVLCDSLYAQMTPNRMIETFGDSDRVSIVDVLHRGAVLFKQSRWKSQGNHQFDEESLYTMGYPMAKAYEALAVKQDEKLIYDGVDSGMHCVRSSWKQDASFTMFTCGSLGSGHGHSDHLHISLYYQGAPVFIDPGRYTYREDHPLRVELKRMRSHNTVLIDEQEYSLPKDSWGYASFGIPCKPYVRHRKEMHYMEGMVIGQDPLQLWIRKLVIIDPAIWVIIDEVHEDGEHQLHQYFHLDPTISAAITHSGFLLEDKLQVWNTLEKSITTQPCSLRYNEQEEHQVLHAKTYFHDHGEVVTCICPASYKVEKVPILQNLDIPVEDHLAQAIRCTISPEESYTIVCFHKELYTGKKICSCEGLPFHAKALVIHESKGKKTLSRLRS